MARDFPGTSGNYISASETSAIDITGSAITVSAWVKPDTFPTWGNFVSKYSLGGGVGTLQYLLRHTSSGLISFYIGDGSFDLATGATVLSTSVWSHIAGVKDGVGTSTLRVYLNGTQDGVADSNRSLANLTSGLGLGGSSDGQELIDGLMAEVAIWNIALSTGELAALAKGVPAQVIRPSNLKGYWPLHGVGSSERDYSGLGTHATITGTVAAGTRHPPVTPFVPHAIARQSLGGALFNEDSETVYLDLQPSTTDVVDYVDQSTVLLDLQPSALEEHTTYDAAEVYLDLSNLGGECYTTWSAEYLGEGEAFVEFFGEAYTSISGVATPEWSFGEPSLGEAVHC